jgi:hypothetical protein
MTCKSEQKAQSAEKQKKQYKKPQLISFQPLNKITLQTAICCDPGLGSCSNTVYGPANV